MSLVQISGNASGTGTLTVAAPSTNTNRTLTLPDGTGTFTVAGVNSNIVAGTVQLSTSGTSITFSSIPSWVKRITVMFNGVSTSGTSTPTMKIGSGSITSSGYAYNVMQIVNAASSAGGVSTTGSAWPLWNSWAANYDIYGIIVLTNITSNTWVVSGTIASSQTVQSTTVNGSLALSGVLDRVAITTSGGTDTFDAGSINILYE